MRKLKVIQVGLTHDHSSGMMEGLQRCLDMFDIVGYVDDRELITTACCNVRGFHLYENLPQLTLEEALNYPDLDAVFVEVTNGDLVRIAQMFADRKIPIHMDKPAGTDLAAYKKLLDTCEKYDLPFQMGYMFRGNMAMQLCLKAQREGWLGEVFEIQADMNHNYGSKVFEEYLACYPGGLMFNLACHFIDLFVKMLGEPQRVIPFLKTVPGWQPCNQNNCRSSLYVDVSRLASHEDCKFVMDDLYDHLLRLYCSQDILTYRFLLYLVAKLLCNFIADIGIKKCTTNVLHRL